MGTTGGRRESKECNCVSVCVSVRVLRLILSVEEQMISAFQSDLTVVFAVSCGDGCHMSGEK